jgi:hypothetical protein
MYKINKKNHYARIIIIIKDRRDLPRTSGGGYMIPATGMDEEDAGSWVVVVGSVVTVIVIEFYLLIENDLNNDNNYYWIWK